MMDIRYRRELGKLITVFGNAAEIGVAEGYFSADILSWDVHFPKLYMVDRWRCVPTVKGDSSNPQGWHDKNLAEARARVSQFGDRAVFLQGDSTAMAKMVPNRSLALLYIDGDHSFEGVYSDLLDWVPKVRTGGIVALHDYEAPQYGVKEAVTRFCAVNQLQVHLLPEDKPEDAGACFCVQHHP